jgi:hypothetical protein
MALSDKAAAAAPYVDRLLDDAEVQAAVRRAAAAGRETFNRARGKSPDELVRDKRLRRRAQQAATATWEVWTAVSAPPPRRSPWRRRLVLVAVAGAGLFLAVNDDARGTALDLLGMSSAPTQDGPEQS